MLRGREDWFARTLLDLRFTTSSSRMVVFAILVNLA